MQLKVEHLLYGLALLLAAALRLFTLGAMPLHLHEAQNAWLAWLFATGQHVQQNAAPVSALYHTLQALIFLPGFTGDAVARFVPAVAGIALVALPWWWRGWLGRHTALLLTFLFALDPWMIAYSRLADGTMLSIFLGMFLLTAILQQPADVESRNAWCFRAAIAAGLLLASGPLAWSFVPIVVVALLLIDPERRSQLLARNQLVWSIATLLVAASGLLFNPQLLGAVSRSLSLWLAGLTSSANDYPLSWWLVRLWADQPLLVVFGAIGFLLLLRQIRSDVEDIDGANEKWLILIWLVWGVLLGIAPGRSPLALPMIGLPLLFMAATTLSLLFNQEWDEFDWSEGRLFFGLLVVLFVSGLLYTISTINSTVFDAETLQPIGLMIGLGLLLTLLYALWINGRQALVILGYLSTAVLFVATLSANWQLNYHDDAVTPDGFYASATHVDVRRLASDVATISAQRYGDAASMPVLVELDSNMQPNPILGWYLHESQVRWVAGASTGEGIEPPPLLITTHSDGTESGGTGGIATSYMGSTYRVQYHWLPNDLQVNPDGVTNLDGATWRERIGAGWTSGWRARLRWLIYRESKAPLPIDPVTLWAP